MRHSYLHQLTFQIQLNQQDLAEQIDGELHLGIPTDNKKIKNSN